MTPTRQAEEVVDPAHPFGVAAGQVVVDGDDMHALAGERVQVGGERRHQRLALAGPHLGDAAFVQHHAADQLDVEVALAEHALGGLAHRREGRHQDVVERPALAASCCAELRRARRQLLVAQRRDLGFERVDRPRPGAHRSSGAASLAEPKIFLASEPSIE